MGTVQDMATSKTVTAAIQKLFWNPKLADTFLTRNTFFSLVDKVGMGRHETFNHKYNWGEYTDAGVKITTTTGDANKIVDSGTDYKSVIKNDVLYCETLDTHLLVESTPSDTSITCGKMTVSAGAATELGAVLAAADYGADVIYYKIGVMQEDGSLVLDSELDAISYFKEADDKSNYTQIQEDYIKISKQAAAEKWQFSGMTRREHMRAVKMAKHIDKIEKTMWHGVSVADTNSTNGRYGSRGFFNFQSIQTQTGTMAAFDHDNFLTFCRAKVMASNEKEELDAFVNPYMLQMITRWVKDTAFLTFDAQGKTDKFGIRVFELVSPQVVLKLRQNRSLKDIYPSKAVMAVIDLSKVGMRYLAGSGENYNTSIEYDVQPTRANFFLDKIYSDIGLELHNAENHSSLVLT